MSKIPFSYKMPYTLEEFINAYSYYDENKESRFGMEFYYHDKRYRFVREPANNNEFDFYSIDILDKSKSLFDITNLDCNIIGVYKNIFELLDNTLIENKKLKDVLFDPETEIIDQD